MQAWLDVTCNYSDQHDLSNRLAPVWACAGQHHIWKRPDKHPCLLSICSLSDCQSESWLIAKSSDDNDLMEDCSTFSASTHWTRCCSCSSYSAHLQSTRQCNNVHKPCNKWTSIKSQTLLTIHNFVQDIELRRHA